MYWAAISVRVVVDFIEEDQTVIQKKIIQLNHLKKWKQQPGRTILIYSIIIPVYRPMPGFVINAQKMRNALMAYASAVMVGLAMAINATTDAQSIQFGKTIAVYQQAKKKNVSRCKFYFQFFELKH